MQRMTIGILGILMLANCCLAGGTFWRGDPPAVSLAEAVRLAEQAIEKRLGQARAAKLQWQRAAVRGRGPKGSWSVTFLEPDVGPEDDHPIWDVSVGIPDREVEVPRRPWGSGRKTARPRGFTNSLVKARARLGPEQNRYYCVATSCRANGRDWFFQFQKTSPRLHWVSVDPVGNVGHFVEQTPEGSTNDVKELLQGLPDSMGSDMPYGSERAPRDSVRLLKSSDGYAVILKAAYLPNGFTGIQKTSVFHDNRWVLLYRILYDKWPTGALKHKQISWQIPKNADIEKLRVIHRPDRVGRVPAQNEQRRK